MRRIGRMVLYGVVGLVAACVGLAVLGSIAGPPKPTAGTTPSTGTSRAGGVVAAATGTRAAEPTATVEIVVEPTTAPEPSATTVAPTATREPTATRTPAPTATPCAQEVRIGATCNDGTSSDATGQGACSRHGGVKEWEYGCR